MYHDNLLNLAMYIENGFTNSGKDILATFLDVHGAFDNVELAILVKKLKKIDN